VNSLPTTYLIEKFYTYAGNPTYNKYNKVYNGSCPVCREGKSWLKKKRLFFYPLTNSFYCFNCTRSWNDYGWVGKVSGMSKEEIQAEAFSGISARDITESLKQKKVVARKPMTLPHDSINISDPQQGIFYGDNKFFQKAVEYIKSRRLDTAINKSSTYYISLTDNFHKNRLCIPYFDTNGKIVFFQTRSLDGTEPRYLNKVGCDKTLFGIERVDPELEYLFLFEGPMDAMMVKNGLSVAGLTLTDLQNEQLSRFPFHKRIWVVDNPKFDEAGKKNIKKLMEEKQKVFAWVDKPYKDFNEWAVKEKLDEIDYQIILNNLHLSF
jgi:hypothetical protein